MKIEIEYKGLTLEIDYDACRASGDGWNEPHEPAHVEQINEIKLEEHDLFEMLEDKLDEIKDIVSEKHFDS